jgi:hypothetical protein
MKTLIAVLVAIAAPLILAACGAMPPEVDPGDSPTGALNTSSAAGGAPTTPPPEDTAAEPSGFVPAETPAAPSDTPEPTEDVYYENCAAVRDADAAPIRAGEPGYGTHLDRDGDGVACEVK